MKILSLFIALSFSTNSFAKDLFCNLIEKPNSSELRITYDEEAPTAVALRSPEDENFRELNADVELVFPETQQGYEAFSVKPRLAHEIDWSKEPQCFKEIGTLWYFMMYHEKEQYLVQLLPHFIKQNDRCVIPRFQPQTQPLSCRY
ncbi:MAG: hypothetical protein ACRBBP_06795 [Bdellovibrionales bacterium]